jgi:imidazolonepropionase-like amidohydrolase
MIRKVTVAIASLCLFGCLNLLIGQDLGLVNAAYLDIEKGKYVEGVTILIEDGKIASIGKRVDVPEGVKAIDVSGKYVLPGMIDSHIHFFQSAGIYTRPDFIDLTSERSYEEERAWLLENFEDIAQRYVKLGITTVIDVGGPMTNFDIREQVKGREGFPNIFITGPLISTYQPKAFDIDDPPIIKVNSEEEARAEVRKQLPYKPDLIKIWYIHSQDLPAESTYAIIEATVDESHKHGLPVAVHATQLNTAKLAVRAGADFLVHGIDDKPVDAEFISMLIENEVVLSPTLMVIHKYYEAFSGNNNLSMADFYFANPFAVGTLFEVELLADHAETIAQLAEALEKRVGHDSLLMANLKTMYDAGITIATGTDAGNIGTQHASSLYEEMQWMSKAGMSNADILKASTLDAARAINVVEKVGSIEEGKFADLVILDKDPLKDLDFAEDINLVIKGGHAIDPDKFLPDSPEMLAQRQLNAYNARNIEAFLEPYAEDVEIYQLNGELLFSGKEEMRKRYSALFQESPDLLCKLKYREVYENIVIDHEKVRFSKDRIVEATAIYKVEDGKIKRVDFIR